MRKLRDCPALLRNTAAPAGFKHYNQFAPMCYQKDGGRFRLLILLAAHYRNQHIVRQPYSKKVESKGKPRPSTKMPTDRKKAKERKAKHEKVYARVKNKAPDVAAGILNELWFDPAIVKEGFAEQHAVRECSAISKSDLVNRTGSSSPAAFSTSRTSRARSSRRRSSRRIARRS